MSDLLGWWIVLGVSDAQSTRRIVRLLLADPLTEEQSWEELIDSYGIEGSNGLLIRLVTIFG
jgi:hypothetical protein